MKNLNVIAGLIAYIILVFTLEWQLELLSKATAASFNTQLFFWGRSLGHLLEASGLFVLTWFVIKAEKNRFTAWMFVLVGLFLTFYTPVAVSIPVVPARYIPIIFPSEFVGAYCAVLGIYLIIPHKQRKT